MSDKALVFVIRGAMPSRDQLEWLSSDGADFAFVHLPGFFSPMPERLSVEDFAATFDEQIGRAWPERRIVVLGVSVGAIVAAAMRAPQMRAKVLIEPFFSTGELWALHEMVRAMLPGSNEAFARWVAAILGIGADRIEPRDYGRLISIDVPAHVLAGDVPLHPRRPVRGLPSLTSERDKRLLREAGAEVSTVSGRHNLPADAPEAIRGLLARVLADLDEDDVDAAVRARA